MQAQKKWSLTKSAQCHTKSKLDRQPEMVCMCVTALRISGSDLWLYVMMALCWSGKKVDKIDRYTGSSVLYIAESYFATLSSDFSILSPSDTSCLVYPALSFFTQLSLSFLLCGLSSLFEFYSDSHLQLMFTRFNLWTAVALHAVHDSISAIESQILN